MHRIISLRLPYWIFAGTLLVCEACSSDSTTGNSDNSAGAGAASGGAGGAAAGQGGVGGNSTSGQPNAGAAGTAQGGVAGTDTGGNAGTEQGGASGSSGGVGGAAIGGAGAGGEATGGEDAGGPVVLAGCANNDYDLCLDFENGIDTTEWTGGTENAIVTTDFAHGTHGYQLYSCADDPPPVDGAQCHNATGGGKLVSVSVGAITNQIWGRFYVHFKPGAPGGHGNIVAAFEGSAWYELGWQFDGLMGVWHNGGENPLRSMPYILDQWYCVELLFDGTKTDMPSWWIDGQPVQYYKGEPNNPTQPHVITQFDRIEVGFTPYANLAIRQPDGVGDQTEMRTLTGMWIDDIAFDHRKRIGCITP